MIFVRLSKVRLVIMYFLIKRFSNIFSLIFILLNYFYVEFAHFIDKHNWSGNMDMLTLYIEFRIMISQPLLYYLYNHLIYHPPLTLILFCNV